MQTHIRVSTCVYVYVMCGEQLKDATKNCVLLDTHFLKYPNIRNWRMHIVLIPTNITHLYYFAAEQGYFIIFDRFEVIFKFSRIKRATRYNISEIQKSNSHVRYNFMSKT